MYSLHPVKRWRYRHIPGPRPWPLLGNLVTLLRDGSEVAVSRWAAQYGSPFLFWLACVHRGWARLEARAGTLAHGFIHSCSGEQWRVARNTWQPFFSKDATARHGQLMAASADRLAAQLRAAAAAGQQVDVWRAALRMTLDVVGTTAFGVDFNVLKHGQGAAGGGAAAQPLSRTQTERLVWALQSFFELFGEPASLASGPPHWVAASLPAVHWRWRWLPTCGASSAAALRPPGPPHAGLGNPYFALFFLFPELEGGIKRLANSLPNRAFKQVPCRACRLHSPCGRPSSRQQPSCP